jgi:hypothetical protein
MNSDIAINFATGILGGILVVLWLEWRDRKLWQKTERALKEKLIILINRTLTTLREAANVNEEFMDVKTGKMLYEPYLRFIERKIVANREGIEATLFKITPNKYKTMKNELKNILADLKNLEIRLLSFRTPQVECIEVIHTVEGSINNIFLLFSDNFPQRMLAGKKMTKDQFSFMYRSFSAYYFNVITICISSLNKTSLKLLVDAQENAIMQNTHAFNVAIKKSAPKKQASIS